MPAQPKTIFFLDYETTGLRPIKDHLILEIGMLAVATPAFEEIAAFNRVIAWPASMIAAVKLDSVVKNMHTRSGLLDEVVSSSDAVTLDQAEREAIAFVQEQRSDDDRPVICGYNPTFDLGFEQFHMPQLGEILHPYRTFDVNVLEYLRQWVLGSESKTESVHRAIDDCRKALRGVHRLFDELSAAYAG